MQPPVRLDGLDRMLVRFAEQHRRPEVGEVEGVGVPVDVGDGVEVAVVIFYCFDRI